ncbi:metallophosphoesterase, partial [Candidatus Moduliflexota bacterium]
MKSPAVLIFLGVVLLIMGVIHAYLNISFVTFLGIGSSALRKALAAALGLLAMSFILSSIGVRVFHGEGPRIFYGISALWFGAALFLVIASTAVWPLAAAVRWGPLSGFPNLPRTAAILLYGLTALFIAYNVAGAHRMKITRLDVSLRNLPESWRGQTVAHLSDLHLGAYWSSRFLDGVVERTLELKPDMIVITGDLFDGSSGGHERYIEGLKRLDAPRGVYFISGNHEVYSGLDKTLPVVRKAGITVLDDTFVTLEGLQLIGVASPMMAPSRGPAFDFAALPGYDRDQPAVLLYHTPTDIDGTS